jgi:hypothetical protein
MVSHALRKIPARLIVLALVLAAAHASASAQAGRFLVVFPSTITTGEYAGDLDLFAALFADDASLAWTAEQPRPIAAQRYREHAPTVVPDGLGGAWLAYTIEHTDTAFGGDQDILLRRIDRFGENVLGDSAASVAVVAQSTLTERNPRMVLLGGAILVVYEVIDRATGAHDVLAMKLDEQGMPLWPAPASVVRSARRERLADVVGDGRGGAIAIVEAATGADSALSVDIIAVHIDGSGRTGWGASSVPAIVAGSRHIERNPAVVADGLGGAYIAYEIEYVSGDRAGDRDIFAQHLTAQGAREWVSESALPIISSVPTAAESMPVIALDTGGIVVAFEMNFPSEKRPVRLIGVQRMDVTGRLTWNKGRKPELVMVPGRVVERAGLLSDGAGGIFLVAEARDTTSHDIDLYAQKFTSMGEQLWANGELPVALFKSDARERFASAAPDGTGGLVAAAVKDFINGDGAISRKIVAQRIGADGRIAWPQLGGPLLLSNTSTQDDRPTVIRVQ